MEILGISLTLLGLIFAYIWRSNGKMMKAIFDGLQEMMKAQQETMRAQQEMMKALERIEQGQEKGFATLAEMLLNQTKILERIDKKLL